MRILAVDDDLIVLEILRVLVAKAGYPELTVALSAGEALEFVTQSRSPYDCILLDIRMPVMDGIEFCDLLRRLPDYADCPIIMVTAVTDRNLIDQAYEAGATHYVTKPFDVHELTSRLVMAAKLLEQA